MGNSDLRSRPFRQCRRTPWRVSDRPACQFAPRASPRDAGGQTGLHQAGTDLPSRDTGIGHLAIRHRTRRRPTGSDEFSPNPLRTCEDSCRLSLAGSDQVLTRQVGGRRNHKSERRRGTDVARRTLSPFTQVEVFGEVEGTVLWGRGDILGADLMRTAPRNGCHRHSLRWVSMDAFAKSVLSGLVPMTLG